MNQPSVDESQVSIVNGTTNTIGSATVVDEKNDDFDQIPQELVDFDHEFAELLLPFLKKEQLSKESIEIVFTKLIAILLKLPERNPAFQAAIAILKKLPTRLTLDQLNSYLPALIKTLDTLEFPKQQVTEILTSLLELEKNKSSSQKTINFTIKEMIRVYEWPEQLNNLKQLFSQNHLTLQLDDLVSTLSRLNSIYLSREEYLGILEVSQFLLSTLDKPQQSEKQYDLPIKKLVDLLKNDDEKLAETALVTLQILFDFPLFMAEQQNDLILGLIDILDKSCVLAAGIGKLLNASLSKLEKDKLSSQKVINLTINKMIDSCDSTDKKQSEALGILQQLFNQNHFTVQLNDLVSTLSKLNTAKFSSTFIAILEVSQFLLSLLEKTQLSVKQKDLSVKKLMELLQHYNDEVVNSACNILLKLSNLQWLTITQQDILYLIDTLEKSWNYEDKVKKIGELLLSLLSKYQPSKELNPPIKELITLTSFNGNLTETVLDILQQLCASQSYSTDPQHIIALIEIFNQIRFSPAKIDKLLNTLFSKLEKNKLSCREVSTLTINKMIELSKYPKEEHEENLKLLKQLFKQNHLTLQLCDLVSTLDKLDEEDRPYGFTLFLLEIIEFQISILEKTQPSEKLNNLSINKLMALLLHYDTEVVNSTFTILLKLSNLQWLTITQQDILYLIDTLEKSWNYEDKVKKIGELLLSLLSQYQSSKELNPPIKELIPLLLTSFNGNLTETVLDILQQLCASQSYSTDPQHIIALIEIFNQIRFSPAKIDKLLNTLFSKLEKNKLSCREVSTLTINKMIELGKYPKEKHEENLKLLKQLLKQNHLTLQLCDLVSTLNKLDEEDRPYGFTLFLLEIIEFQISILEKTQPSEKLNNLSINKLIALLLHYDTEVVNSTFTILLKLSNLQWLTITQQDILDRIATLEKPEFSEETREKIVERLLSLGKHQISEETVLQETKETMTDKTVPEGLKVEESPKSSAIEQQKEKEFQKSLKITKVDLGTKNQSHTETCGSTNTSFSEKIGELEELSDNSFIPPTSISTNSSTFFPSQPTSTQYSPATICTLSLCTFGIAGLIYLATREDSECCDFTTKLVLHFLTLSLSSTVLATIEAQKNNDLTL